MASLFLVLKHIIEKSMVKKKPIFFKKQGNSLSKIKYEKNQK